MSAFTTAPIKRLLKKHGKRVGDEAAKELAIILEEKVKILATESEKIARHSGRRTVLRRDVKLAKRVLGK